MSSKSKKAGGSATQAGSHSKSAAEKKVVKVPGSSPKKAVPVRMDTSGDELDSKHSDGKEVKTHKAPKDEKKVLDVSSSSGERDWSAGFRSGDVNLFISKVYKWRFIININPKTDLIFTVDEPGKNQNKRRKGKGGGWKGDADAKFVNCKFTKDKDGGWSAQIVTPICNVMTASLGMGDWEADPRNKGKMYLKKNFRECNKTICLDATGFEAVELDEMGRNKSFMTMAEKDKAIAEQLALFMLTERTDLNKDYVEKAYEDAIAAEALQLKMKFDTAVNIWREQEAAGKMTNEEYWANVAKAQKQYLIKTKDDKGEEIKGGDEVDLEVVNDQLDISKPIKIFMKEHYTDQLKKRQSDGVEYMAFQAKVFRAANEKEIKNPTFFNQLCKRVWDETGFNGKPKLVYNTHKWDFMSQWGKAKVDIQLCGECKDKDAKERDADCKACKALQAAEALKDYERPLDPMSKVALVYTLKIFTESPQSTFGFHRNFTDIIFFRTPNPGEVSKIKASQGSRVSEADKLFVPGAGAYTMTELSTKVFEDDPKLLQELSERIALEAKMDTKNQPQAGSGSGPTQTKGKRGATAAGLDS